MAEVYEFHVAGLVGPVVRAALPELTTQDDPRHTVLTGTAGCPDDIDDLLLRLHDHGFTANHILIAREGRWRWPVVTDGETPDYSAPRQS